MVSHKPNKATSAGANKAPANSANKNKSPMTLSKKIKCKFLKAGMSVGYAYFADDTADLPLEDFKKLEASKIVKKV